MLFLPNNVQPFAFHIKWFHIWVILLFKILGCIGFEIQVGHFLSASYSPIEQLIFKRSIEANKLWNDMFALDNKFLVSYFALWLVWLRVEAGRIVVRHFDQWEAGNFSYLPQLWRSPPSTRTLNNPTLDMKHLVDQTLSKYILPCELQETNMIQSFSWKYHLIHPTARFCFCRLIFLLSFPLSWLQWRVPARGDLMQILTSGILNDTVVYEKSGEPLSEASIWILSSTTSRKGGLFSYCTFFHTQSKERISIWLL